VGEALAITEGLKEFGSEALTAADNVTHASIALTTLTGSGEAANTTIEGLEQLGMSDGLAFPSLLTAGTRMQAMLGPTADVTAQLALVADGAALMGTDIVSAAARFDQMATAALPACAPCRISGCRSSLLRRPWTKWTRAPTPRVHRVRDVQDHGADGSYSGFGYSAPETWRHRGAGREPDFQRPMAGACGCLGCHHGAGGQALLPVIADLVQFTKTDIVPFITNTVEAFNQLPGPLRTVVAAGCWLRQPCQ